MFRCIENRLIGCQVMEGLLVFVLVLKGAAVFLSLTLSVGSSGSGRSILL